MFTFLLLIVCISPIICMENNTLSQEVFNYHVETMKKSEYAFEVVDIMYNSFRQWYFTITFCEFTYFENRILKYTENYGDGYNVMLLSGCPYSNNSFVKPKYDKHGQTAYLVTSDQLSIEMSEPVIEALKRTGVFKPRSAVIFVINTPIESDKYFYYTLKSHFQLLWSRSITNSVLILKSDRLRMYAYNPFLQIVRDITHVTDVSHFLSRQYTNLHGYELRLSVFRNVYLSDETGPVLCDSNLAKTVMSSLNATCLPVPPRDNSTTGDLFENGTATGITADLMDEYTDFELRARILKNSFYGYIDTTYPLVQDALCFICKKSDFQSTFNATIHLITLNVFFLFVATFIIFIIVTVSFRKMESKIINTDDKQTVGDVIVNLIKCFLRQTVEFTFIGPVFRCLVLLIIIYSLIINCAIDGILTTAVTYPRYKPDLNTMTELAASNLTIGIHNRDFHIVNTSFSSEFYKETKNRVELINDHKIRQVINERMFNYVILLKKTDADYITSLQKNMKNAKPIFHVMSDCPCPCFLVYGLRYGSPYLPRLDYIIKQLTRGGILQYWSRTEKDSAQRNLFPAEGKEKKPLGIFNVKEMFYLLVIGEIISTFVFALELLLHKFNNSKK